MGKVSDKDMRHCFFLKLTCDIRTPHQGPQKGKEEWLLGGRGGVRVGGGGGGGETHARGVS